MTPLSLAIMIAFGGVLAFSMGSESAPEEDVEEDPVPEDPVDEPVPVDPADEPVPDEPEEEPVVDTGATVIENEDGSIDVELGADETGSLLAIVTHEETDVTGTGSVNRYDLTLLLVPEGVDFPRELSDLPEDPQNPDGTPFEFFSYSLSELADFYDAEELGHWLIGAEWSESSDYYDGSGPIIENQFMNIPTIMTEEPFSVYYAREFGAGLLFSSFQTHENFDFLEALAPVRGSEDDDTLSNDGHSHTYGLGGDDVIDVDAARAVMGGDGNDTISATDTRVVRGDAGDDVVVMGSGSADAFGDDGNDTLVTGADPSFGDPSLHGGAGEDVLIALRETQLLGDYRWQEGESDTFMIWDQGLGETVSDTPVQLGTVSDFGNGSDQLVILTRGGLQPVTMTHADGILTLEYANGSVGQIRIDEIDPAVITFADVDDVLSGLPVEAPPAA